MTGTGVSVALPVLISPILTRLYLPEDMGVLATFVAITMIVGTLSNGRYELAIVLPKDDDDAINLLALSLIINFIISVLILILVIVFKNDLNEIFFYAGFNYTYLIPLATFFIGLLNLLNAYNVRLKKFGDIAKANVIKSISLSVIQLSVGFFMKNAFGLISGEVFSKMFANIKLIKNITNQKLLAKSVTKGKIKEMSLLYKKFPIYDVPASLFNIASFQIIPVLLKIFFSSSIAGFFYLSQRVISSPVTLISSSVLDVFKERAAKDYLEHNNAREIYLFTFKRLSIMAIIPTLILLIFADDLFVFFFGAKWLVSAKYASIMSIMLFFRFVSNPLSYMFYIGNKQMLNMILQLFLLIGIVLSFLISDNDITVIYLVSSVFSLFYLSQIFFSARIAKVF